MTWDAQESVLRQRVVCWSGIHGKDTSHPAAVSADAPRTRGSHLYCTGVGLMIGSDGNDC